MCSNLVRDMNEYGVCVLDNFIGEVKGLQVLQEVKSLYAAGFFKVKIFKIFNLKVWWFIKVCYFQDGQLVASKDKRSNRNIRGDKITWVDGNESGVSYIKFLMNQVRILVQLNLFC